MIQKSGINSPTMNITQWPRRSVRMPSQMNSTTQMTASTAARMPVFTVGAPSLSGAANRPTGRGADLRHTTNLPVDDDGAARGAWREARAACACRSAPGRDPDRVGTPVGDLRYVV